MKTTLRFALLACLSLLSLVGMVVFSTGHQIIELSESAIDEWYPKRKWVCWEHSGEFTELFVLSGLGMNIRNIGFVIIIICAACWVSLLFSYQANKITVY